MTTNRVVREMESRIRELERQLGRKTLEAEILRKALDKLTYGSKGGRYSKTRRCS